MGRPFARTVRGDTGVRGREPERSGGIPCGPDEILRRKPVSAVDRFPRLADGAENAEPGGEPDLARLERQEIVHLARVEIGRPRRRDERSAAREDVVAGDAPYGGAGRQQPRDPVLRERLRHPDLSRPAPRNDHDGAVVGAEVTVPLAVVLHRKEPAAYAGGAGKRRLPFRAVVDERPVVAGGPHAPRRRIERKGAHARPGRPRSRAERADAAEAVDRRALAGNRAEQIAILAEREALHRADRQAAPVAQRPPPARIGDHETARGAEKDRRRRLLGDREHAPIDTGVGARDERRRVARHIPHARAEGADPEPSFAGRETANPLEEGVRLRGIVPPAPPASRTDRMIPRDPERALLEGDVPDRDRGRTVHGLDDIERQAHREEPSLRPDPQRIPLDGEGANLSRGAKPREPAGKRVGGSPFERGEGHLSARSIPGRSRSRLGPRGADAGCREESGAKQPRRGGDRFRAAARSHGESLSCPLIETFVPGVRTLSPLVRAFKD